VLQKDFIFPKYEEQGISDPLLLFAYTNEYGNTLSQVVHHVDDNYIYNDMIKN